MCVCVCAVCVFTYKVIVKGWHFFLIQTHINRDDDISISNCN